LERLALLELVSRSQPADLVECSLSTITFSNRSLRISCRPSAHSVVWLADGSGRPARSAPLSSSLTMRVPKTDRRTVMVHSRWRVGETQSQMVWTFAGFVCDRDAIERGLLLGASWIGLLTKRLALVSAVIKNRYVA